MEARSGSVRRSPPQSIMGRLEPRASLGANLDAAAQLRSQSERSTVEFGRANRDVSYVESSTRCAAVRQQVPGEPSLRERPTVTPIEAQSQSSQGNSPHLCRNVTTSPRVLNDEPSRHAADRTLPRRRSRRFERHGADEPDRLPPMKAGRSDRRRHRRTRARSRSGSTATASSDSS